MAPNKRKMLEAARKSAQKGAKERALKEYEQLLKLDPKDAKLRLEIGDLHRRWGQIDEAAAAYQRVAEQYTSEGFDARAVAVYKQIQGLDGERHGVCEPLAELYQRMGLVSEAIGALQAAADVQARTGNKRRALELLRTMAGLDPTNTTSRIKVADLLRGEKMLDEAAAEYDAACAELTRQGDEEAAGRVIERLLELQPDRADVLMRLARNLLARGKAAAAEPPALRAVERNPDEIPCLELLAEVYRAQKRDDRLEEVYRKIAGIHRQHGDSERARDILQRFVPGGAFDAAAALAVEPEPSSPFGSDSLDFDDRAIDPALLPEDDDELLLDEPEIELARPVAPAPAATSAARASSATASGRTPAHTAPPRPAPRAAARPNPAPPADPAAETVFELGAHEGSRILGDPEQLLAEASVYLRYGKRAQAIENLQAILASQPQHRIALEKLGDAYADDGDAAGAVAAWLRAGELARDQGDLDAMRLLRDRVGALDEGAAATLMDGDELDVGVTGDVEEIDLDAETGSTSMRPPVLAPPRAAQAPDLLDDAGEDIDLDLDGVDLEPAAAADTPVGPAAAETTGELELDIDVDTELGASSPPAVESTPAAAPADAEQIGADLEEAEFYWQQGLAGEARALFAKVLAAAPGHPLALVRLGEIAAAAGEDPDTTGGEAADRGRSAAASARAHPDVTEPDALGSEAPGAWLAPDEDPFPDADGAAEESAPLGADLSLKGLDEDGPARAEPPAAVTEPEPRAAAAITAPAPSVAPPLAEGDGFDLAAELSAALDDAAPESARAGASDDGFQAVFDAFKRGVQKTLGSADHEAHYDLGIAYREMGLLDDAIGEFRSAMQSTARRIDSLHMLGLCALAQGRADEAVDLLSHALAAPDLVGEQELAIRFELGRAYASSGEVEKARLAWEKVAAVDASFCEVGELLHTLGETPRAVPAAEFESFGDLLAETDAAPAAPAAQHESFDDLMRAVNADLDAPADPPASPDPSPPARPGPAPAREPRTRRGKISFV